MAQRHLVGDLENFIPTRIQSKIEGYFHGVNEKSYGNMARLNKNASQPILIRNNETLDTSAN